MGRFLPLLMLMMWLVWSDQPQTAEKLSAVPLVAALLGPITLWGIMSGWAWRLLVDRRGITGRSARRFHRAIGIARLLLILYLGLSLWVFGYGAWVMKLLEAIEPIGLGLPGMILGIGPAVIGLTLLWLPSYPIERALREQNLFAMLEVGLPVHAPPSLRQYLDVNIRQQLLFVIVPVIAAIAVRDAIVLSMYLAGAPASESASMLAFGVSIAFVLLMSPLLLRWVLAARPLAPSPLRDRLEAVSRRVGVRFKDILLWDTGYTVGNAAVMGVVPRVRYVLLSDLLVETLSDEQIEAVFAHEAGHIRHRHLLWHLVLFLCIILCMLGPMQLLFEQLTGLGVNRFVPVDLLLTLVTFGLGLICFGSLSRLYERQADTFAARTIDLMTIDPAIAPQVGPMDVPVGPLGRSVFVSALRRVAEVNNLPVGRVPRRASLLTAPMTYLLDVAANFLHPSIPDRVEHLERLAAHPMQTARFDRGVGVVKLCVFVLLLALGGWAMVELSYASTTQQPLLTQTQSAGDDR